MEPYFVEDKGRFKLQIYQDEYVDDSLFDPQIALYSFNSQYIKNTYFKDIQDNWLEWLISQLPFELADTLLNELNAIDNLSISEQTQTYAVFQRKVLSHIHKDHYLWFIEERGSTNYNSLHYTTTTAVPDDVEFIALVSKKEAQQLVGDASTSNYNNITNSEALEKKVANYLRGDLDTLESIYNGNVWAYSITDTLAEEVVDSCSGFIENDPIAPDSYVLSEARSYLEHWIAQTDRRKACVEIELF